MLVADIVEPDETSRDRADWPVLGSLRRAQPDYLITGAQRPARACRAGPHHHARRLLGNNTASDWAASLRRKLREEFHCANQFRSSILSCAISSAQTANQQVEPPPDVSPKSAPHGIESQVNSRSSSNTPRLRNSRPFRYNGNMDVLTAAEMRQCDERTVEQVGISWQELMEAAGSRVAEFVARQFPAAQHILVLCGKGNNGGDGLVAARHLEADGKQVRIVLLATPEQFRTRISRDYQKLPQTLQQSILPSATEEDLSTPLRALFPAEADSFSTPSSAPAFIRLCADRPQPSKTNLPAIPAPVVSVDLPTGWDADSTAMSAPDAFRSDAVITFTAPKLAHVFGALTRGPVAVAQIGSPAELAVSKAGLHWTGASKKIIEQPRALDSNKGRFGHVLVIGGSPGKGGAAAMASLAAMRAGAGLTTAAIPRGIASIVAGFAPELMTILLEESSSGGFHEKF